METKNGSAICLSNALSSMMEASSEDSSHESSSVLRISLPTTPVESPGQFSFPVIFKPHNSKDLIRVDAIRRRSLPPRMKHYGKKDIWFPILWILCAWLPMALYWSIFFIRDYNASIPGTPAGMMSETN